ncbi:MAG: hypothetical protein ACOX2O_03650 [Bdellovibrionota bacterium]|jgi:hypothetical protein
MMFLGKTKEMELRAPDTGLGFFGAGSTPDLSKTKKIPENIRKSAKEARLNTSVLEKLSSEGLNNLRVLLSKGPKHARLTIDMLNGVHRTSPGREDELLKIFLNYKPRIDILDNLLKHMGTNDPFIATERAQVRILTRNKIQKEGESLKNIEDCSDQADESTSHREGVRGVSGHLLGRTNEREDIFYTVFDPDSPATSVGLFGRRQAILGPFENFATEKFSEEKQKVVRERRSSALRDALGALTFEDLVEAHPKSERATKSPLLSSKLNLYKELQNLIISYKSHLDSFCYLNGAAPIESFNVRADLGGGLLKWFQRKIDTGELLPEAVLEAYAAFSDPCVYLSPEEERFYCAALLSYSRLHSFLDKRIAFAGIESDISVFKKLAEDDPLKRKWQEKIQIAKGQLQELYGTGTTEMRVFEFADILEKIPLMQIRYALNKRCYDRYGEEFEYALKSFEALFVEDGKTRPDSLSESVPLGRLSKTIFGTKIISQSGRGEKDALFTREEFKAIKDGIFLNKMTAGVEERLFQAAPISDFTKMVETVIVAYRKAKGLQERLRYLEEAATAKGEVLNIDREDVDPLQFKDTPITLPFGEGYRPLETLAGSDKRAFENVWECVRERNLNSALPYGLDFIDKSISLGLYPERIRYELERLQAKAAKYIHVSDLPPQIIRDAEQVITSPFISISDFNAKELLQYNYLTSDEVKRLFLCATWLPNAKKLELCSPSLNEADLADLLAFKEKWDRGVFFYGSLIKDNQLKFHNASGSELCREKEGGFSYITPTKLKELKSTFDSKWLSFDELDQTVIEKLDEIASKYDGAAPNRVKEKFSDTYYISKSFVNEIKHFEAKDYQITPVEGMKIGPTWHFKWANVEGELRPCFNFGKYKGRAIAEVATEIATKDLSWRYFSEFLWQEDFPKHVKAVAIKIFQLGQGNKNFPEKPFIEWVKDNFHSYGAGRWEEKSQ